MLRDQDGAWCEHGKHVCIDESNVADGAQGAVHRGWLKGWELPRLAGGRLEFMEISNAEGTRFTALRNAKPRAAGEIGL